VPSDVTNRGRCERDRMIKHSIRMVD